jgi:hypothetical protein
LGLIGFNQLLNADRECSETRSNVTPARFSSSLIRQIAQGHDADNAIVVIEHRQATDLVLLHNSLGFFDVLIFDAAGHLPSHDFFHGGDLWISAVRDSSNRKIAVGKHSHEAVSVAHGVVSSIERNDEYLCSNFRVEILQTQSPSLAATPRTLSPSLHGSHGRAFLCPYHDRGNSPREFLFGAATQGAIDAYLARTTKNQNLSSVHLNPLSNLL